MCSVVGREIPAETRLAMEDYFEEVPTKKPPSMTVLIRGTRSRGLASGLRRAHRRRGTLRIVLVRFVCEVDDESTLDRVTATSARWTSRPSAPGGARLRQRTLRRHDNAPTGRQAGIVTLRAESSCARSALSRPYVATPLPDRDHADSYDCLSKTRSRRMSTSLNSRGAAPIRTCGSLFEPEIASPRRRTL